MFSLIRLACAKDIPLLRNVELSAGMAFNAFPNNVPDNRTLGQALLNALFEAQTLWVAVTQNDEPIGFVASHPMGSLFYVHELSVAFPYQKQGLGRRLMQSAITYALEKSYPAVGLTTRRDVPWNKPFYESLGFVEMEDCTQYPALYQQVQKEIAEGANASVRCAMVKPLV